MLSSVLNSKRAIEVNVSIMRTFVKMRSLVFSNLELKEKINELEKITFEKFNENDKKIKTYICCNKKSDKRRFKTKRENWVSDS